MIHKDKDLVLPAEVQSRYPPLLLEGPPDGFREKPVPVPGVLYVSGELASSCHLGLWFLPDARCSLFILCLVDVPLSLPRHQPRHKTLFVRLILSLTLLKYHPGSSCV